MTAPQPLPPASIPQPEQKDTSLAFWLALLVVLVALLVVLSGIFIFMLGSRYRASAPTATLTPTSPPPPTAAPPVVYPTVPIPTIIPATPASQGSFGTATDYLNIRSGPGMEYPIYGVAQPGATAQIVGKSADNAWWAVKIPPNYSPDGVGWASASYVIVTVPPNVPVLPAPPMPPDINPPPPPPSGTVVQTTEPTHVRSGPGSEYPSYGKVQALTLLNGVGISQDQKWVAVTIPTSVVSSGIGWVSAAYLKPFDHSALPVMQP